VDNSTKSAVYKLISYLLSYPGEPHYYEGLPEAKDWALELEASNGAELSEAGNDGAGRLGAVEYEACELNEAVKLAKAAEMLMAYSKDDLELFYSQTFDFSEARALYLTSHELGDSRNRGPALLELRKYFMDLGYIEEAYHLPDYLPALFELLAIVPEDVDTALLRERMSVVCQHVHESLPEDSPYRLVLEVAIRVLPTTVKDAENPFPLREEADLDELPFPIFYD
jgi:nitrate reductase molybdenum cofactor assembly chaperone NarJ/NarW